MQYFFSVAIQFFFYGLKNVDCETIMANNKKKNNLTTFILIALVAGVVLGNFLNGYLSNFDAAGKDKFLEPFAILSDIFLRLIKMVIAPLVFSTLVVGVAKQGSSSAVGRIGAKTMLWFIGGSLLSLFLGMFMVNFFQPGQGLNLPLPINATSGSGQANLNLKDFIYHIFPTSIFDALAKNEILQVVVFSLFFGLATAAYNENGKAESVIKAIDAIAHITLKITEYIMNVAPLAVFGAMTTVIARQGISVLVTYSKFISEFYLGLILLFIVLMALCYVFMKKQKTLQLLGHVREPFLIAFSTSSSEAAFPKLLIELVRFGCNDKIVSFVLPLGYSFNLDGSMMYMTFASIFIAQSYNIHLDTGTQITMLLVLMLTSKGIAGVPRASLVIIAGTLATFHLPDAGMVLLLGIDPIMDMGRASMNVIGNSVATVVVNKWEGFD
jgi:Na+/H+-dicarboxylate symporter